MKPTSAWSLPADYEDLTEGDFEVLAHWMYDRTGVRLAPQKRSMAQARLSRRLRATGLGSFTDYLRFARHDAAEAQWVLDLLTTHETRFFRESGHFAFIQQKLLPETKSGVRIWSAACSTGQEAYSLGMLLLAERLPGPWSVFGTDISLDSVGVARRGEYSMLLSEQIPRPYLRRFCLRGTGPRQGTFRVGPELRERARFETDSLLQPRFEFAFDWIFLKNVLIYFDERSRNIALANVWRRLVHGGYLFVGAAETLRGTDLDAAHVHHGVYRKR